MSKKTLGRRTFAYIANIESNDVTVIDTSDGTVWDTIELGPEGGIGPYGVAVSPSGSFVYVRTFKNDAKVFAIDATDPSNHQIVGSLSVGSTGGNAASLAYAMTVNGPRLYAANPRDGVSPGSVAVIDVSDPYTLAEVARVTVGLLPAGVAANSTGTRVFVANLFGTSPHLPGDDDTVHVIDTDTNMVVGDPVVVGDGPLGLSVSLDGSRLYVPNSGSNTVSVIDVSSPVPVLTQTVTGLCDPYASAVHPSGDRVFVTNNGCGTVQVINTATLGVQDITGIGTRPHGISLVPSGTLAYVANNGGDVAVVNTTTHAVSTIGTSGNEPASVGQFIAPPLAVDLIQDLIGAVTDLNLPRGVSTPLINHLEAAAARLSDGNPNNDQAACAALNAFITQVQNKSGQPFGIAPNDAADLIASAEAIKALAGC